jgi:hypothetical protein
VISCGSTTANPNSVHKTHGARVSTLQPPRGNPTLWIAFHALCPRGAGPDTPATKPRNETHSVNQWPSLAARFCPLPRRRRGEPLAGWPHPAGAVHADSPSRPPRPPVSRPSHSVSGDILSPPGNGMAAQRPPAGIWPLRTSQCPEPERPQSHVPFPHVPVQPRPNTRHRKHTAPRKTALPRGCFVH